MTNVLFSARDNFIQGISRITNFWGFPKAMGAIYASIYLSPEPITLDEICKQVGVTKGSVSTNIRNLERLGLVHKQIIVGDRKDYYLAETDFWKTVKGILKEREKNEFDLAIKSVGQSLELVKNAELDETDIELAGFYKERMMMLKSFFDSLDNLVATIIALDDLRTGVIGNFFKK
jgi:DNA-binding transcriptional regulator GbsR (MarR family)